MKRSVQPELKLSARLSMRRSAKLSKMRSVKTFLPSNVVLLVTGSALRSQSKNAGMFLAVSVRPSMAKNATKLPNGFARKFITRSSAVMWSPRSVRMCPRRSVTMFRRGSVRLLRRKSARLFQELSALKPPTDSVAASQSRSVQMFLSSSVSRFLRLIVRCLADNLALKYHQGTVNRKPDVFALLSPRSKLRKLTIVNAQLTRGMFANPFPNRSAMMLMSLVRSVMISPMRFVKMFKPLLPSTLTMRSARMLVLENVLLQPDKSAMMWLSRFQNRLMRLNVRLSTPRNARNPVVDMETNLFDRYIVFRQNIV